MLRGHGLTTAGSTIAGAVITAYTQILTVKDKLVTMAGTCFCYAQMSTTLDTTATTGERNQRYRDRATAYP